MLVELRKMLQLIYIFESGTVRICMIYIQIQHYSARHVILMSYVTVCKT